MSSTNWNVVKHIPDGWFNRKEGGIEVWILGAKADFNDEINPLFIAAVKANNGVSLFLDQVRALLLKKQDPTPSTILVINSMKNTFWAIMVVPPGTTDPSFFFKTTSNQSIQLRNNTAYDGDLFTYSTIVMANGALASINGSDTPEQVKQKAEVQKMSVVILSRAFPTTTKVKSDQQQLKSKRAKAEVKTPAPERKDEQLAREQMAPSGWTIAMTPPNPSKKQFYHDKKDMFHLWVLGDDLQELGIATAFSEFKSQPDRDRLWKHLSAAHLDQSFVMLIADMASNQWYGAIHQLKGSSERAFGTIKYSSSAVDHDEKEPQLLDKDARIIFAASGHDERIGVNATSAAILNVAKERGYSAIVFSRAPSSPAPVQTQARTQAKAEHKKGVGSSSTLNRAPTSTTPSSAPDPGLTFVPLKTKLSDEDIRLRTFAKSVQDIPWMYQTHTGYKDYLQFLYDVISFVNASYLRVMPNAGHLTPRWLETSFKCLCSESKNDGSGSEVRKLKKLPYDKLESASPRLVAQLLQALLPSGTELFKYMDPQILFMCLPEVRLQGKSDDLSRFEPTSTPSQSLFQTVCQEWTRVSKHDASLRGTVLSDEMAMCLMLLANLEWQYGIVPASVSAEYIDWLKPLRGFEPLLTHLTVCGSSLFPNSAARRLKTDVLADVLSSSQGAKTLASAQPAKKVPHPAEAFLSRASAVAASFVPASLLLSSLPSSSSSPSSSSPASSASAAAAAAASPASATRPFRTLSETVAAKQVGRLERYIPEYSMWYDEWFQPTQPAYVCVRDTKAVDMTAVLQYVTWLGRAALAYSLVLNKVPRVWTIRGLETMFRELIPATDDTALNIDAPYPSFLFRPKDKQTGLAFQPFVGKDLAFRMNRQNRVNIANTHPIWTSQDWTARLSQWLPQLATNNVIHAAQDLLFTSNERGKYTHSIDLLAIQVFALRQWFESRRLVLNITREVLAANKYKLPSSVYLALETLQSAP
jgi:hypothetical protein